MSALDAAWLREHPLPRPGDGGKTERGSVVVVGGKLDLVGAVLLAGEASLRAGAGKVSLFAEHEAVPPLVIAMPEARVLCLPDAGGDHGDRITQFVEEHLRNCDALLIGPGMIGDEAGIAKAVLRIAVDCPTVIDAGALSAMGEPTTGPQRILTPHAGEMARLLDCDETEVVTNPLATAQKAAGRFGATVVLKGASTYVVRPEGDALLYAGGGAGLGVSGSGDVLAGIIAGLLARGCPAFDAAAWGVFLHGQAGARLAEDIGPLGFLAREIAPKIPALMAAIQ